VQINIVVAHKSTLARRRHDHKGRMAYLVCRNSTSGTVRSPSVVVVAARRSLGRRARSAERGPTLAAEVLVQLVRGATSGTGDPERGSALGTERSTRTIERAARRAGRVALEHREDRADQPESWSNASTDTIIRLGSSQITSSPVCAFVPDLENSEVLSGGRCLQVPNGEAWAASLC
jgi:hypothetical protein